MAGLARDHIFSTWFFRKLPRWEIERGYWLHREKQGKENLIPYHDTHQLYFQPESEEPTLKGSIVRPSRLH